MRTIFGFLAFASCLIAAPIPKGKVATKDSELILGMWEIVADRDDGQLTNESYRHVRWVFKKDNRAEILNGYGTEKPSPPVKVIFALHPDKKPKHFDWSFPEEGKADEKIEKVQFQSLYELDGDTLKVCFGNAASRPEGVSMTHGQLTILRRVKDGK